MMRLTLQDVEQAIEQFPREQQQRLLAELPRLLRLPASDLALLRVAQPAFLFWENPDDAIYDTL